MKLSLRAVLEMVTALILLVCLVQIGLWLVGPAPMFLLGLAALMLLGVFLLTRVIRLAWTGK